MLPDEANEHIPLSAVAEHIGQQEVNRSVTVGATGRIDDWSVTNQKKTGRCWIFAGTNLLRVGAMKKMNL
ncbi:unnamed protein product, partial [marine sediment metagenome]